MKDKYGWANARAVKKLEKIAKSVLPSEDGAVVSEKIVTENGTVFSVIRIKSNAPTGIAAFE